MARLDLTQNVQKNVVELTNNITQVRVELNAGLLLSENVTQQGTTLPSATTGQLLQYNGTDWTAVDLSAVLPTATTGQYLQWNGTNWVAVSLTTSGGVLQSDIVVTDTVGNVTAGTTLTAGTSFEDIFNQMMVSYQAPSLSVTGWTTGTFEHGASFSDTTFSLAFTNDANLNTGVSGTYNVTDSFITGVGGVAPASDGGITTASFSGDLLVTNSNAGVSTTQRTGAATLTVSGHQNSQGGSVNSVTKSSTVRFRYWVVDRAESLNQNPGSAAQLMLANADSSLNGTGSDVIESGLISSVSTLGFTATGSYDYVYWILPAAFTVNNITQNTSINLYAGDTADQTTAVIYLGEFDSTNQHGESVRMQILRSKVTNAFAAGSVIAVS